MLSILGTRRLRKTVLSLLVLSFMLGGEGGMAFALSLKTFLKTDYGAVSQRPIPRPNVLFLLDTGSPMVFSPKGIMPLQDDPYSKEQRAGLLRDCTYGSGSRPHNENPAIDFSRYGRDLDSSNNRIGDPDCYYTSDPKKPYFLTFKKPDHHKEKPASYNDNDLVPNDSRMYMMKLVLWRLTDPTHAELLSRMNLGMATSYQEDNFGQNYYADFYKRPNWGRRGPTGGSNGGPALPHGSAPSWSIGFGSDGIFGQNDNYYESQRAFCGVNRDYYDTKKYPKNSPQWRRVNRSVMKVPFDRFYVQDDAGNYQPTDNRANFRMYIDGVESANTKGFTNPEMFADGQTPLSTSLYAREEHAGNNDTHGYKLIQYAPRDISYGYDKLHLKEYFNTEGVKGGQAVGSAIDFFAPKTSQNTEDGLAFSHERAGYFPISDSCQSNWVVIFTAGNDESNAPRPAAKAALELYKKTQGGDNPVRGRAWDARANKWVERQYVMDKGVRTMVVGFVDPDASDANSQKLRNSLNAIAAHGQPKLEGGHWVPDTSQKALFANDVPALLRALEVVFRQIDAESRPTPSGAPLITQDQTGSTPESRIFSRSYLVRPFDQWGATFSRSKFNVGGESSLIWEAGAQMKAQGKNRRLYTTTGAQGDDSVTVRQLKDISLPDFKALADLPNHEEKFRDWLYFSGTASDDPSPLGDTQNSNFLFIPGNLHSGDVYIQTNRGTLHALNAATGEELWGFIPPNILQGRVKAMKYNASGLWYDGDGKSSRRSMPVTLLDGILTPAKNSAKETFLLGTLGRGGNGIYAMDITKTNTTSNPVPVFLWAVENARYDKAETPLSKGVYRWGEAAKSGNYDYEDLGLTLQGITPCLLSGDVAVAILPGGLGYKLGADSHGKVFFLLNPKDGAILRKWGPGDLSMHATMTSLGMGVAPVTLVRKKPGNVLSEFYTADSMGNILSCVSCDVSRPEDWSLKSLFCLKASDGTPVAIPKGLLLLERRRSKQRMIIGGTCDVVAPGSDSDSERRVHNSEQFIFGIKSTSLRGEEKMADLLPLSSEDINTVWKKPGELDANKKGWYLTLQGAAGGNEGEYVTTSPFFFLNEVVVTTFIPQAMTTSECALAQENGDTRLFRLDAETGKSHSKLLVLKNLRATGVTGFQKELFVAMKELKEGALDAAVAENPDALRKANGGVWVKPDLDTGLPLDTNTPYIDYWRDIALD